jgi:hypothetical protein
MMTSAQVVLRHSFTILGELGIEWDQRGADSARGNHISSFVNIDYRALA